MARRSNSPSFRSSERSITPLTNFPYLSKSLLIQPIPITVSVCDYVVSAAQGHRPEVHHRGGIQVQTMLLHVRLGPSSITDQRGLLNTAAAIFRTAHFLTPHSRTTAGGHGAAGLADADAETETRQRRSPPFSPRPPFPPPFCCCDLLAQTRTEQH